MEERYTRSGWLHVKSSPAEEIAKAGIDPADAFDGWVWACNRPRCGMPVQGGRPAMAEHVKTIHPEELQGITRR